MQRLEGESPSIQQCSRVELSVGLASSPSSKTIGITPVRMVVRIATTDGSR